MFVQWYYIYISLSFAFSWSFWKSLIISNKISITAALNLCNSIFSSAQLEILVALFLCNLMELCKLKFNEIPTC